MDIAIYILVLFFYKSIVQFNHQAAKIKKPVCVNFLIIWKTALSWKGEQARYIGYSLFSNHAYLQGSLLQCSATAYSVLAAVTIATGENETFWRQILYFLKFGHYATTTSTIRVAVILRPFILITALFQAVIYLHIAHTSCIHVAR